MTKKLAKYTIIYCDISCDRFIDLRSIVIANSALSRNIELKYYGDDKSGDIEIHGIDSLSDNNKVSFVKLIAETLYPRT